MVNTKEISAECRLSHWAEIIQERVQSGKSIRAYCKEIGICGNTYYYWQRKLRKNACEQLNIPENPTVFKEVCITDPTTLPEPCPRIRIEYVGIQMTLDSSFPMDKLAELLRNLSC